MLANQRMLQTLLAERFKLVLHPDTRELELYTLVIAENGPKLQQSKPGNRDGGEIKGPDGQLHRARLFRMGKGELTAQTFAWPSWCDCCQSNSVGPLWIGPG
jgi:uncharacterized protein (TIGR03435 family)